MSSIQYPAVFHKENKSYWVEFPDLEGCFSQGASIEDAYSNAKEALGQYLDQEKELFERNINKPSDIETVISNFKNEYVMLVDFDSIEYARQYKNKAVKKTLTVPEWLNDLACKENINFSNVLQEGLMQKLNLK